MTPELTKRKTPREDLRSVRRSARAQALNGEGSDVAERLRRGPALLLDLHPGQRGGEEASGGARVDPSSDLALRHPVFDDVDETPLEDHRARLGGDAHALVVFAELADGV